MKNFFIPILAVLTMSLTLTSSAFAQESSKQATTDQAEVKTPSLTFYYFDQWPMCHKIKVIVNDLKKTQGTEVTFKNMLVSEENAEEIKKAKLKGHGIIAKDKEGNLVEILSGHNYDEKKVKAIVSKLLAK